MNVRSELRARHRERRPRRRSRIAADDQHGRSRRGRAASAPGAAKTRRRARRGRRSGARARPRSLASPTSSSIAEQHGRRDERRRRARRARCPPGVEPRTAKNSAFLPRMSKSGCASANAGGGEQVRATATAGSLMRGPLARDGVVEDAGPAGELLGALDPEPLGELALERLAVVVRVRARPLARRAARPRAGRRASGTRSRARSRGPRATRGTRRTGTFPRDDDVVDDREAERRGRACRAPRAVAAQRRRQPSAGRRVGHVADERQDRASRPPSRSAR